MVSLRATSRRAVALVDAVVGVVILGVSLTVILSLTGQAFRSLYLGEELQNAAMLADEQLNLVLARGPDDYAKTYPITGECDAPFERFSYSLKIEGQGDTAPYTVSCTITWASSTGKERSEVFSALIASRTLTNQIDRQPQEPVERDL